MRHIIVLTCLSLLASLLLGGCGSSGGHAGTQVGSIRDYKGTQSQFADRGFQVIQNQAAWQALWGGQQAPAVDFTTESVVAAIMGSQPGEGASISISDGRLDNGNYVTYVDETKLDPKKLTGNPTAPYHMVVVPKISAPLSFVLESSDGMAQPAILDQYLGQQSRTAAPDTAVLTEVTGWKNFCADKLGMQTVPVVDFTKNYVVSVMVGDKPTAGYSVQITEAAVEDEKLIITYRLRAPMYGDIVAQVITRPYAAAVIQKTEMPIVFRSVGL